MAAKSQTVMTLTARLWASDLGLRMPDFGTALAAQYRQFAAHDWDDAADVLAKGMPNLVQAFAYLGVTGADAAGVALALTAIADSPNAAGATFPSRAAFLSAVGRTTTQLALPAVAPRLLAFGLDMDDVWTADPTQRFSVLSAALLARRVADPAAFVATLPGAASLATLLDNFDVFEAARVGFQAAMTTSAAPIPLV